MDGPNHYDVSTARWTAPDPIGDRGSAPDWYGYCLDDPANGVDPVGLSSFGDLYDEMTLGLEEAASWNDVYVWRAEDGACKECEMLDGSLQNSPDIESVRPHPNCKCRVETCRQGLEGGEWKFAYAKESRYEVNIIASNVTGAAAVAVWKRITPQVESRMQRLIRRCPSAGETVLGQKTLYRERNRYETHTTKAICWGGGGDASEPGACTANNPWTGETVVISR